MEFENIGDLVNQINTALDEFCNEFGRKRKELAGLGKVPKRGILFTYDQSKGNDWAINEGGGTEVQYHIAFNVDDLEIRYGLGFNTQYVPFANQMSTVEYMQPFMIAFLKYEKRIREILPDYGFVYGNIDQLRNPQHDQYTLFGKTVEAEERGNKYFVEDNDFQNILSDLRNQFEVYQIIFTEKNNFKKVAMSINNSIDILTSKGQIILQGPPGTGKTYTAKDIAEKIIFNDITDDKKKQKQRLEETEQFKLIQFHPAYSYEDFVRGIVAESKGIQINYVTKDKLLADFAKEAYKNWKAATEPKEKVARETWVKETLEDFKDFLAEQIEEKDEKLMITGKVYINRITENSIRYNSDAWEVDGGVPVSDIIKMYLADTTTRRQIKDNPELTKTAKSLSTYWLEILKLFKKYIADNNLKPIETSESIPEKIFVLIIDEINRANLPAVLGELIYALEYRGEKVESMYPIDDDNTLVIPPNLYIIGTMNTSDRSVGHIDYAIRRRFAFIDVLPKVLEGDSFELELFKNVSALFIQNLDEYLQDNTVELKLSEHLSEEFRPEDVWLGHSYFIKGEGDFSLRKKYEIVPILKEYVKDGILKKSAETIINTL
ncbi:MAG: AAA family ATPase [Bacteroidetes bacterium]|nr:AAA family ATPase [Bacteroidota bacterium]